MQLGTNSTKMRSKLLLVSKTWQNLTSVTNSFIVERNPITDGVAEYLPHFQQLKRLSIGKTKITEEGLSMICCTLTSLTSISVRNTIDQLRRPTLRWFEHWSSNEAPYQASVDQRLQLWPRMWVSWPHCWQATCCDESKYDGQSQCAGCCVHLPTVEPEGAPGGTDWAGGLGSDNPGEPTEEAKVACHQQGITFENVYLSAPKGTSSWHQASVTHRQSVNLPACSKWACWPYLKMVIW